MFMVCAHGLTAAWASPSGPSSALKDVGLDAGVVGALELQLRELLLEVLPAVRIGHPLRERRLRSRVIGEVNLESGLRLAGQRLDLVIDGRDLDDAVAIARIVRALRRLDRQDEVAIGVGKAAARNEEAIGSDRGRIRQLERIGVAAGDPLRRHRRVHELEIGGGAVGIGNAGIALGERVVEIIELRRCGVDHDSTPRLSSRSFRAMGVSF
jgi:hypothetical protein